MPLSYIVYKLKRGNTSPDIYIFLFCRMKIGYSRSNVLVINCLQNEHKLHQTQYAHFTPDPICSFYTRPSVLILPYLQNEDGNTGPRVITLSHYKVILGNTRPNVLVSLQSDTG